MKNRILLLDWDGCMAKTLHVWMNTYMTLYKQAGVEATEKEILEKSWGNLEQGPRNFGIEDPEEFWKKIVATVRASVSTVPLYDGVKETLVKLKDQGIKMAIVTSSERSLVLPPIEYHGLLQFLDAIVTPDDIQIPKPNREIVDKAVSLLGGNLSEDEVYIVGDTGSDIKTGLAAGIPTVFVNYEKNALFTSVEKVRDLGPNKEFSSFEELVNIFA